MQYWIEFILGDTRQTYQPNRYKQNEAASQVNQLPTFLLSLLYLHTHIPTDSTHPPTFLHSLYTPAHIPNTLCPPTALSNHASTYPTSYPSGANSEISWGQNFVWRMNKVFLRRHAICSVSAPLIEVSSCTKKHLSLVCMHTLNIESIKSIKFRLFWKS